MDHGVSNEPRPDDSRPNLMLDNEKDTKGGSKLPGIPGRNKQGKNGQGGGKNGGSNRPRIPPWVIAVLFLGLVAYQLYAIFDHSGTPRASPFRIRSLSNRLRPVTSRR